MDILTNEQCCEVIGWKYRPGMPIYNGLRPWQGTDDKWHALPDFHQSLDACFKWLVPWLDSQGLVYQVLNSVGDINNMAIPFVRVQIFNNRYDLLSNHTDKSPSIAFIKAFTSMVREG